MDPQAPIAAAAAPLRELAIRHGRKVMLSYAPDDGATPFGVCFEAPYGGIAIGHSADLQVALQAAEADLAAKLTDSEAIESRRLKVETAAQRAGLRAVIDKMLDEGADPAELRAKLEV